MKEKPKYISWSYSRLSDFRKCPLMFEHKYVLKTVPFVGNKYTEEGNRVHKVLENRVGGNVPLQGADLKYEAMAASIQRAPGTTYVERNITLDHNLNPCGDKDWDNAWVRIKIDVLQLLGENAWAGDYKTGKPTLDEDQLKLTAAGVFQTFSEVQRVTATYLWLQHDAQDTRVYTRDQNAEIWESFMPDVREMQASYVTGSFAAKPSNFNCGYCEINKAGRCSKAKVAYRGT